MTYGLPVIQRFTDAIGKRLELRASRNVEVRDVKTVCLALGPYRNLTTLTASMLFLHPNCQVLNHAGGRILGDRRLDFLMQRDRATFDAFKRYAIYTSASGRRGEYGGSITHSHAFDANHSMRELFDRGGGKLIKQRVDCLFWKESQRTSNHIRAKKIDLDEVFARTPELRFLLPVRNPLDCAVSNLKTGLVSTFVGLAAKPSQEQVVAAILDEFLWVAELKRRHSERVFVYFEHEFSERTLRIAAEFLQLPCDEAWLERALAAYDLKSGYAHPETLIAFYRRQVEDRFGEFPEFEQSLLRFGNATVAKPGGVAA